MGPLVVGGWLWAALACAEGSGVPPDGGAPATPAAFTVRGRWPDPHALTWRLDAATSPLPEAEARGAVERALALWSETGCVGFRPAGDAPADVTFSFVRGDHGECLPFGRDEGVAHTGPVAAPDGTFVHFDAGLAWGEHGLDLAAAAAHELGHALGLGHSDDPAALLHPRQDRVRASLGPADRAGIHSLYGGGTPGPGDLEILHAAGPQAGEPAAPALARVAPVSCTAFAVLDADGDGADEILVWRTDDAGFGSTILFRFGAGPRLESTVGPVPALADPSARNGVAHTEDGRALFVTLYPNRRVVPRTFDELGRPGPWPSRLPLRTVEGVADVDGDSFLDEGAEWAPEPTAERRADLDGDGTPELIRRR